MVEGTHPERMTLDLVIAGLRLRLVCDPPKIFDPLRARYAPFAATESGPALIQLTVHASDVGDTTADPAIRFEAVDAGGACYRLAGAAGGEVDFARAVARAWLASSDSAASLESLLRTVYAHLALRAGGMLLHAAGVLQGDEAYLFIGQSGSGKSTVAMLSLPAPILSDDLVIVLPTNKGWSAHSTPFWNAAGLTIAPGKEEGYVAGVYRLIQDTQVFVELMSPALATAELAANCPVVNGDPAQLPELLALCRRMAASVPVERLHFRKNPGFWQIIRSETEQEDAP